MEPDFTATSITEGIAVGYGINENGTVSNIARMIRSPIISHRDCSKSEIHQALLSHRGFCGGYANGTGVCAGDSGSGLYVLHNGKYYLRGIVSASLYGFAFGCNVDEHAIFTDVLKFYDWIIGGGSNTYGLSHRQTLNENKKLKEFLNKMG